MYTYLLIRYLYAELEVAILQIPSAQQAGWYFTL